MFLNQRRHRSILRYNDYNFRFFLKKTFSQISVEETYNFYLSESEKNNISPHKKDER